MVIEGLVDDRLATMSFNEHHYIVKKVAMSFSTFYYLGLEPKFGNYIKENNTVVVSGKLSKSDLLEEEATIYSGITITKDKEYININNIKENTNYLKNIDVKTGECFSRLYVDGDITDINGYLYSYRSDDSLVLVTPNLDKKSFNVYNLKKELSSTFSMFNLDKFYDKFNVMSVNYNNLNNYFEMIVKVGKLDTICVPFTLDDKKNIKFYPFIFSEYFHNVYKLKEDNTLISFKSFPYYFSKSELININKKKEIERTRIYVNMRENNFIGSRK